MRKGVFRVKRKIPTVAYWRAILDWFKILQENELTSSDYKILFYLCEKMSFQENEVHVRQKKIAEELNMNKGNVSKCIKRLCEKQFIVKAEYGFMINPHLFYVGKGYKHDREILRESFDELLALRGIQPRIYLNENEFQLEVIEDMDEQELRRFYARQR